MSLFSRIQGVFFSPQMTFKGISEKPVWVDGLVILLIVSAVFSYVVAPYSTQDTLKAFRDNVKLQERLGKERYEANIKSLENPSQAAILLRTVGWSTLGLTIGLLVSSLFLLIFGRLLSTEGSFIAVFAVLLHANFIDKILGNAVRLVLILSRKSVIQTTTSLAIVVPKADFTSTPFILLSQIDFFQLWMFAVIGFGLAQIFKVSVKKAMVAAFSFWFLKSLFYIALLFLSRSFLG